MRVHRAAGTGLPIVFYVLYIISVKKHFVNPEFDAFRADSGTPGAEVPGAAYIWGPGAGRRYKYCGQILEKPVGGRFL